MPRQLVLDVWDGSVAALLRAFPSLRKVEQLGYLSVKPKTQANLWLYASQVNT